MFLISPFWFSSYIYLSKLREISILIHTIFRWENWNKDCRSIISTDEISSKLKLVSIFDPNNITYHVY